MKSTTYSNKTLINHIKTPHYFFQYHKIKQLYSLFLAKLVNEQKILKLDKAADIC